MKILCLGDSITFGYGVPTDRVWTTLATEPGLVEFVNRGVSGNTTGGMLAQLVCELAGTTADAVLFMGGANDIMLGGTCANAQSNMGAMGHLTAARGLIPIFGIAPPGCPPIKIPWDGLTDFRQSEEIATRYREWLRRMCGLFRYPVVDFDLGLRKMADIEGRPRREYYLDGLHMNAEGHRAMAQIVLKELERL